MSLQETAIDLGVYLHPVNSKEIKEQTTLNLETILLVCTFESLLLVFFLMCDGIMAFNNNGLLLIDKYPN